MNGDLVGATRAAQAAGQYPGGALEELSARIDARDQVQALEQRNVEAEFMQ